jgi:hypothetical protein
MNKLNYLIAFGLLFLFQQCIESEEPTLPSVTSAAVTQILTTTAVSGGEVTKMGNADVFARGVCWSTLPGPTINDNFTFNGISEGAFVSSVTGLTPATTYYLRAYATNSVGTAYGDEIEFTTSSASEIITTAITGITKNQATSGGSVISNGGSAVLARGVCWSTTQQPTIANSKTTDGTGNGAYTSTITGLAAGTTYYVRAYATTAIETFYGNEVLFTTEFNTATFYSVKDATIFNNQAGNDIRGNYGAGGSELLQVGYASGTQIYARTLVQFDLSDLPVNAVIETVKLEFTLGSSGTTIPVISVFKLTQGWTEGATAEVDNCKYNTTCNIQGTAISGSNDVTWNEVSYSGTLANPWTTLGGNFAANASAASNDANASSILYVSSGLKNDVLSWIATPSSNNGWLLKTDFITSSSAMRRFLSREGALASGNPASAPRLVITYK